MMDHMGSIGISKSILIRDLQYAIPYNSIISNTAYHNFIKEFANKQNPSAMGYAMYAKQQIIDDAIKELHAFIIKQLLTRKNMPTQALNTIMQMI